MVGRKDGLSVQRLFQQINRLSEDLDQLKQQAWRIAQAHRTKAIVPENEDVDAELRALVGIDPPMSLTEERRELKRILAKRYGSG